MAVRHEDTLTALVILGVGALAIYRFICWVMEAPRTPDPWGKDADEALDSDAAVVLCHHCLTPQEHNGWFCPNCGTTVGPYSNYMPYIYAFSQGEVLRAGVTERVRRSGLVAIGFVLFSLSMCAIARIFVLMMPIYWFYLFKNLWGHEQSK